MVADRYIKIVLTVIAVALVVIAVRPSTPVSSWLEVARPQPALVGGGHRHRRCPGQRVEPDGPGGYRRRRTGDTPPLGCLRLPATSCIHQTA